MIDYEKLWVEIDEIAHQEQMEMKQPYERTIADFEKLWHTSKRQINKVLDKLVAEGKMNVRLAKCLNGKITKVYSPLKFKED